MPHTMSLLCSLHVGYMVLIFKPFICPNKHHSHNLIECFFKPLPTFSMSLEKRKLTKYPGTANFSSQCLCTSFFFLSFFFNNNRKLTTNLYSVNPEPCMVVSFHGLVILRRGWGREGMRGSIHFPVSVSWAQNKKA